MHNVFVRKPADFRPEFRPRHSCHLVHHQSAWRKQTVTCIRGDWYAKKRSVCRIACKATDGYRSCLVETVILNDYGWTGLASIVLPACERPNLASLHLSGQSETASIKFWSSFSCALLATANDCRRASFTNSGERTSGTHIWMGRRPCSRSRLRYARTLSREEGDEVRVAISYPLTEVTCNLARLGRSCNTAHTG